MEHLLASRPFRVDEVVHMYDALLQEATEMLKLPGAEDVEEVSTLVQVSLHRFLVAFCKYRVGLMWPDLIHHDPSTSSFLWMVFVLEWIAGRIPRGTHDWRKFLNPNDLAQKMGKKSLSLLETSGIVLQSVSLSKGKVLPLFKESKTRKSGVYAGAAVKL